MLKQCEYGLRCYTIAAARPPLQLRRLRQTPQRWARSDTGRVTPGLLSSQVALVIAAVRGSQVNLWRLQTCN